MKGYHKNIEKSTVENDYFRKVEYTSSHLQLVLMTLKPNEEIGFETHTENDQFFRFEKGVGMCVIDDNVYEVTDGDAIIVPAGAKHNITNTSSTEFLKLYTIYAPPHHQNGIIHKTKEEAESDNEEYDGVTTE
jgi:mannose-6-phosphate isomerase-like protein (cupin superfamily)